MLLGRFDARVSNHYKVRNGCAYCEWVNVVWQLRDVRQEDTGFTVVPATRTGGIRHLNASRKPLKIAWVCPKHVPMKAVAVLSFIASAQAHGAIRLGKARCPAKRLRSACLLMDTTLISRYRPENPFSSDEWCPTQIPKW